jgi:hypothetical protein
MTNAHDNRRETTRFPLSVDLKFLLRGSHEAIGMLLDISENGLALISETRAEEGDEIVVYPIGLGRLEGKVVRTFEGGMGVEFMLSESQRDIIRQRLKSVLGNIPYMRLKEKRSSVRIQYTIESYAYIESEEKAIACTIRDMSRSGCRLQSNVKPAVGAEVTIGTLQGLVVRHLDDGFAIEFKRLPHRSSAETPLQRRTA